MNGKEVLVARKKEASTRPRVYVNVGWLLCKLGRCSRTRIRAWYIGVGIGSRAANERVCAVGRLCATYVVCCNLYSARLQFYLLHVFVANRAHTVYVKPRCWHVHATFPFQNRFWRRAPRRLSQRRRRFSRQGCTYSALRHSSSFESFFFFFIYPSLSLACIRIEASNVRYSNYHRCSVVLDFVIIVMCAFDNWKMLCYISIFHRP